MAQSLETIRGGAVTPIYGRRLGLQRDESLGGPIEMKLAVEDLATTVPTTILAYGVTRVLTSGSSQGPVQHNLPAPIPGIRKYLIMDTTSTGSYQFMSTANGASILAASDGTTKSLINFVGQGGVAILVGLTTAKWGVLSAESTGGVTYTTST
jgi:hypothetical protein